MALQSLKQLALLVVTNYPFNRFVHVSSMFKYINLYKTFRQTQGSHEMRFKKRYTVKPKAEILLLMLSLNKIAKLVNLHLCMVFFIYFAF